MPLHHLATIAVLGADTVVGGALCALLGGCGYRITPIDARPTGVVDELLEGANLLLLAPRLDGEARDAFLGAMMGKRDPQRANMPVIALCTGLEEGQLEQEWVLRVSWPCETRALIQRIEAVLSAEGSEDPWPSETGRLVGRSEAALLDAPAPSAAPDTQARRRE